MAIPRRPMPRPGAPPIKPAPSRGGIPGSPAAQPQPMGSLSTGKFHLKNPQHAMVALGITGVGVVLLFVALALLFL